MSLNPQFNPLGVEDADKLSLLMLLRAKAEFNTRILSAFESVPRRLFLDKSFHDLAYKDISLPLPFGQSMERPSHLAFILSHLNVMPHHKVLEVGTGSGYLTALFAALAGFVYGVEFYKPLLIESLDRLRLTNVQNVRLQTGDGRGGLQTHAPYDRIFISGAMTALPKTLKHQLSEGGKLICSLGEEEQKSRILCIEKGKGENSFEEKELSTLYVQHLLKRV